MKQLNSKLFKGIYEIYNIDTDTVSDIVVADSEYNALPNGNENEGANDFFEEKRTIQDLREELKEGRIDIYEALKTTEDLFYDIFDKEDYEIKVVHNSIHSGTIHSQQYMIVDKVQGVELIFDVDYNKYDIFYVSATGIFFAVQSSAKLWLDFVNLMKEVQSFLHDWNYGEEDE